MENGTKCGHMIFVAETKASQKVGELTCLPVPNLAEERAALYVQAVFVEKEFRGKGVFRALYEAAVARTKELIAGLDQVELMVERANEKAKQVYLHMGFLKAPVSIIDDELTFPG